MRKQQEQPSGLRAAATSGKRGGGPKGSKGAGDAARAWLARVAVGAVFLLNVTCAMQFAAWPEAFAPAYGLPPTPESYALVAGLGVAFFMWNCTYPPVIASPVRFRVLFAVILAQQAVGLAGESLIYLRLAQLGLADAAMAHGILRFIAFDAGGFALMLVAFIATRGRRR